MDLVCYEVFEEEEAALRRHLPKQIQTRFSSNTLQAESSSEPAAKLISIRTQSLLPLAWAEKLSGVLTRSSGYDHLLAFQSASRGRVALGYLPSYCEQAVAEQALLMVLALARRFKRQIRKFRSFNRNGMTGVECAGRNLLVVGVGRIGSRVVRLARGVGMRVKGVDLVRRRASLTYVSLKEGIGWADVVVCALPFTESTRSLLNERCLRHCRPGTILVNVGRGEISPLRDLKRLLQAGVLGGVGLDVYEEEGVLAQALRGKSRWRLRQKARELLQLQADDNVIFTPHNAFNTEEALERKAKKSCDSIVAFLKRGKFLDPVPG